MRIARSFAFIARALPSVVLLVLTASCGRAPVVATPPSSPAVPRAPAVCDDAHAKLCMDEALTLKPPRTAAQSKRLVELLAHACTAGAADGCTTLARIHTEGKEAPSDLPKAAKLLERGCTLGDLQACTALGHALMDRRGVEEDMPRAITLFRKACDGGEPQACLAMGRATGSGGIEALYEPERSVRHHTFACDKGIVAACSELALAKAEGRGTPPDRVGAKPLAERACDVGIAVGCVTLAAILIGEQGDESVTAAAELFERACALGESQASVWACARVAQLKATGKGFVRDEAKARVAFDRACAAAIAGKPEVPDKLLGCIVLAAVFEVGYGLLAEKDPELTLALYNHACGQRSGPGCAARAIYHERTGRKAEAMADYRRACALGVAVACERLKRR